MKTLVIGLGSMGKRRIRCLQKLNVNHIVGFDVRSDRCEEAKAEYGVTCLTDFQQAWDLAKPEAVIISVPPHLHVQYMQRCLDDNVPFFVEASVVDDGLEAIIAESRRKGVVAAPSTTLRFHPAIALIRQQVESGRLGKISNVLLHSGQYLPDWHTYEKVSEFYVSRPDTGGGREIVPFELTWFTDLFDFPRRVCANYRKTIEIEGAEYIDDTYNCLLDYGTFLAVVTVDVVSRSATRRLTINGSKGQLTWSWDDSVVKVYDAEQGKWLEHAYQMEAAASGYNPNIGENMYIDEVKAFLDAAFDGRPFPNTLERDHRVLKLLYALERSDNLARYVEV